MTRPGRFPLLVLGANVVVIFGSILFAVAKDFPPRNAFDEGQPATWFSALQLLATGVVALLVYRRRRCFLWLLIAGGFVFLMADELLELHERMDFAAHRILGMEETAWTDRLDDLLVALYGGVGLAVLAWYRTELVRFRAVAPLFVAGFLVLFLMVALDAATNRPDVMTALLGRRGAYYVTPAVAVVEDSLKLLGGGVFLVAMHRCLQIASGTADSPKRR